MEENLCQANYSSNRGLKNNTKRTNNQINKWSMILKAVLKGAKLLAHK
jgi:hypothetical protein